MLAIEWLKGYTNREKKKLIIDEIGGLAAKNDY